jgi:uncharacterized cupin superfamily protein
MAAKEPDVVRSVTTADDLAPDPMDPSWILEGNPQARSRRLFVDPDRSISAILWDCTAGRFDWHYGGDEIIQIVDGEAELTFPSGTVTTVKPGDIVYFPGAQIVQFNVPHYIRKVSLYSSHPSLPRRVARRIPGARRFVNKVRASRSLFIA